MKKTINWVVWVIASLTVLVTFVFVAAAVYGIWFSKHSRAERHIVLQTPLSEQEEQFCEKSLQFSEKIEGYKKEMETSIDFYIGSPEGVKARKCVHVFPRKEIYDPDGYLFEIDDSLETSGLEFDY